MAKTLGGTRSEAQTREYISSAIEHWERHGYGFWVFRDRQSGRFIGRAGLRHLIVGRRSGTRTELCADAGILAEGYRDRDVTRDSRNRGPARAHSTSWPLPCPAIWPRAV